MLPLCFNWAPCHEGVLGDWRYSSTHSLTSAVDGGEGSASRPSRFTPRGRSPGTHWIGGWVGPRAVLDALVMRKIPSPRRESNPRTAIVQPVAQRYTDWTITALLFFNWAPHHEGVLGSGSAAPLILVLGTRWRWMVSFTPRLRYPHGKNPCTHWIGGWLGPRAGLDKASARTQTTDHSVLSPECRTKA
jgi:hypothetical protein